MKGKESVSVKDAVMDAVKDAVIGAVEDTDADARLDTILASLTTKDPGSQVQ